MGVGIRSFSVSSLYFLRYVWRSMSNDSDSPDFELGEYVRQDLVYEKYSFQVQVNTQTTTSTV